MNDKVKLYLLRIFLSIVFILMIGMFFLGESLDSLKFFSVALLAGCAVIASAIIAK